MIHIDTRSLKGEVYNLRLSILTDRASRTNTGSSIRLQSLKHFKVRLLYINDIVSAPKIVVCGWLLGTIQHFSFWMIFFTSEFNWLITLYLQNMYFQWYQSLTDNNIIRSKVTNKKENNSVAIFGKVLCKENRKFCNWKGKVPLTIQRKVLKIYPRWTFFFTIYKFFISKFHYKNC